MTLRASPEEEAVHWSPGTGVSMGQGERPSLWIGTSQDHTRKLRATLWNCCSVSNELNDCRLLVPSDTQQEKVSISENT